ncbi:TraI domain-containing protein [Enterobacter cloacae complex sp. P29RS]|uniref:TraI domain-containing protein n=1 Tax=Enterobacter cloacae complex sp. P29RS TaxID=2779563 RepID=UPI0018672DAC|nr:TraI domain-containing protein [Enterobacter cloacae complex sp. P29RS]MBE3172928.1 TraI domain-containing protein [Enterobacter cloacae complex sp. P29RS]
MLKAIKELLVGTAPTRAKSSSVASSPAGPAGYFMPQSATQLLDMPARKQCLQQLWENSALPKDLYEKFYLQPLHHLVTLMQVLPATRQGEYASEGGLVDVTLQTTTYAVRLAKGHMLPPGAAPEDQSAQNILWNAVVFYAALWRYLPQLDLVEGELQSGRAWLPGVTVPAEPYRFRFKAAAPEPGITMSQSALIACRLLPAEAVNWLSTLPAAAQAVMLIASRQPSSLPVIDEIIGEAVTLARGDAIANPVAVAIPSSPMPVPSETSPVLVSTPAAQVALESSVPDVQSAVSGEQVPAEGQGNSADTVAAVSSEEAMPVPSGDVLLSSALDTPVNDLPLAEMVVAPEPAVEVEEDMQALLSLMNVSVSAPEAPEMLVQEDAPQEEAPEPTESERPAADLLNVVDTVTTLPEKTPTLIPEASASDEVPAVAEAVIPQEEPENSEPVMGQGASEVGKGEVPISDEHSGEQFLQWLSTGVTSGEIPINTAGARVHLVAGFALLTVPGIFYLYLKQSGLEGNQREALQESFERLDKHRRVKGKRFYFAELYGNPERTGPFKRTKGYLIKASLLYRGAPVPADSPVLVIP